jgi:hypothetical protein
MERLATFVEKLKGHGIEATTVPNGAVVRCKGRMVAKLRLYGTRLVVGPTEGVERKFNLEILSQEKLATDYILRLRVRAGRGS